MPETTNSAKPCPACSRTGNGSYCAYCGASMTGKTCTGCGAGLSDGVRFCHKCGTQVGKVVSPRPAIAGAGGSGSKQRWIPWTIGLASLLVVSYVAGGWFSARQKPSDIQAPLRGPDISQMSPEEQADRLFNRVMLLSSEGKSDSVLFFAPMAINAYQMLAPLNADQRYDVGRIAEAAGAAELARAQADTILAANPAHLLGLVLGARAAGLTGDSAARKSFLRRLVAANAAGAAARLPEYERHGEDITQALADARREAGAFGN